MPEAGAPGDGATPLTLLGFDYGVRRIGVAVGDSLTQTATPLATLSCRDGRPDWAGIEDLMRDYLPDACVVGLPPTTAGDAASALHARIERFCRQLRGRYRRPVHTVDEHLSSVAADWRGAHPGHRDAVAAQLILETWLHEAAH